MPKTARKASNMFRTVVAGAAAGDDILDVIRAQTGRSGAGIHDATIVRWAAEGLVRLTRRAPRGDEHHRSQPIATVILTAKGRDAGKAL